MKAEMPSAAAPLIDKLMGPDLAPLRLVQLAALVDQMEKSAPRLA